MIIVPMPMTVIGNRMVLSRFIKLSHGLEMITMLTIYTKFDLLKPIYKNNNTQMQRTLEMFDVNK